MSRAESWINSRASGRIARPRVNRGLPAPLLVKYFRRKVGLQWQVYDHVAQHGAVHALNLIRNVAALADHGRLCFSGTC